MELGDSGEGGTSRRKLPHHEATEVVNKPRHNTNCSLGGSPMESNTDSIHRRRRQLEGPGMLHRDLAQSQGVRVYFCRDSKISVVY